MLLVINAGSIVFPKLLTYISGVEAAAPGMVFRIQIQ